ncbi:MAG TPA: Holliday junction resolvase RuvX [Acidimicrobiales bacterium]|nr:Holliday junction resolvase RuvX [Acidimicrobiales bacterium]
MRLLGIDPGSRRCGIAISDSAQTMAFPRDALANDEHLLDRLAALMTEESVGGVIVGRPVALSGNETASTEAADGLYEALLRHFAEMPVEQWDERLTTREAQRALSGAGIKTRDHRERIDSAAAVILLQNYLDARSSH